MDGGIYTSGICGEKTVTLDAGSPLFLTLTQDATDPVLNNFIIDYDFSQAIEADIFAHTVSYTVVFKEYITRPSSTMTF